MCKSDMFVNFEAFGPVTMSPCIVIHDNVCHVFDSVAHVPYPVPGDSS